MRYMLLIYDAPKVDSKLEEEEFPQWMKYARKLRSAGALLGGEELEGTDSAKTIRGASGNGYDLIDGPFTETKEVLSGFFMIETGNIDEALKWASQAPHVVRGGTVEVRPILEMPGA
jgi:hypothetical protein